MKYLRRAIWFIASRLLIACLVLGLGIVTFYYAMNLSNVQIVLKDGMAARAEVVITGAESDGLERYFQAGFLQNDAVLQTVANGTNPYQDYTVTGIDHRLNMGFVWIWPWDTSVRLTVTESIPHIDGRVKSNRADALVSEGGSSAVYPPSWQSATYRAVLVKENDQWLIRSLTWIENAE